MSNVDQMNNLLELCMIRGDRIDELKERVRVLEADAARWRAIAPSLEVDWDEDVGGRRSTWIQIPSGALNVPNAGHAAWGSNADFDDVSAAMDARIKLQEDSKNG